MSSLVLATAAATTPVTLAEAKSQLRVEVSDDDTLIGRYIDAATSNAERYLSQSIITQTWHLYFDEFPAVIRFKRPPVQSVTSITYTDEQGDGQTLDSSKYQSDLIDRFRPRIVPAVFDVWPSTQTGLLNAVKVIYVAGFGDAETDIPENIRQAILLDITHMYENRGETVQTSSTAGAAYRSLLSDTVPR